MLTRRRHPGITGQALYKSDMLVNISKSNNFNVKHYLLDMLLHSVTGYCAFQRRSR